MNVPILPDGELANHRWCVKTGDYVELRPRWTCFASSQIARKVNNPCNGFNPTPVRVLIWDA